MIERRQAITSSATVTLWGMDVGVVVWDKARHLGIFEYFPAFIDMNIQIAPLTMPLVHDKPYQFTALNADTYKGLPGLLADCLPDKFGNALVDQWLAEQGKRPSDFDPVQRLCYLGTRAMGALEFRPDTDAQPQYKGSINIEEMVALCSKILSHRQAFSASLHNDSEHHKTQGLHKILSIGTSAGGARAKAVIAWNPETGDVRSGQIQAGNGYEYWLIKFDGVSDNADKELSDPKGFGRIEYAYHLMAKACGIQMADCRLMEEGTRAHFMTRRFDRLDDGSKLHMQSLCAIDHQDFNTAGGTSYEQAFLVIEQLGLGMAAKEQLFLRMCFNVFAVNRDDHTKQIAFLMDKSGAWALAPAYDMTYAYNPDGQWTSRHQMTINGKRGGINEADLLAVAGRQKLNKSRAAKLLKRVTEVTANWPLYAEKASVSEHFIKVIQHSLAEQKKNKLD